MRVRPCVTAVLACGLMIWSQGFRAAIGDTVATTSAQWLESPIAAAQRPRGSARTPSDLNVLTKQIAASMRTDPSLQGSWLFVEADDQLDPGVAMRLYRLRRVFDRRRASAQSLAMNKLISQLFPAGNFSIDPRQDVYLPVFDVVANVQSQLDLQPKFSGCEISGAYFEESPNGRNLNLVLRGRIGQEAQVEGIERIATATMNRDSAWTLAQVNPSTHNRAELPVVPNSEAKGALFYGQGLQNFWKGRYPEAAADFQRAVLENPSHIKYHYWRVVTELSLGDRRRATTRMENLIRFFGAETMLGERAEIARSLERVQGPFRRELQELEVGALVRVANATSSKK